ncbi:protein of unknown function [Kyrpidia spormannii]|uniref:Uncharacterized protein n=1 Tax=Kyrpidia spormannii TaxID=2055160 RepID=A0ACA8ZC01_9BACL|nr:protein of unknown function [Kyrpidia spormannii]
MQHPGAVWVPLGTSTIPGRVHCLFTVLIIKHFYGHDNPFYCFFTYLFYLHIPFAGNKAAAAHRQATR